MSLAEAIEQGSMAIAFRKEQALKVGFKAVKQNLRLRQIFLERKRLCLTVFNVRVPIYIPSEMVESLKSL